MVHWGRRDSELMRGWRQYKDGRTFQLCRSGRSISAQPSASSDPIDRERGSHGILRRVVSVLLTARAAFDAARAAAFAQAQEFL